MKKFFFSVAAVAAALTFTACSSEDIISHENIQEAEWNEDGQGYVSFRISMPEDARANRANDNFNNGLANEYAVNDAILLIFGGDGDETTAKLAGAYNLPLDEWKDYGSEHSEGININRDQIFTQKISRMGGNRAYAMVVLNNNGLFEVSGTELKVNQSIFSGTISDLQNRIITLGDATKDTRYAKSLYTNGFLMMNAPLVTVPGGASEPNGTVQTLAPITRDNIKPTKEEAKAAVAANIYVERAVAKVTMNEAQAHDNVGGTAGTMKWKLSSWALDNTNKKTYLVRNTTNEDGNMKTWAKYASTGTATTDGVNHFRFAGMANLNDRTNGNTTQGNNGSHAGLTGTSQNLYRTYFAQDPNYDKYESGDFWYNTDGGGFNVPASVWTSEFGMDKPKYCLENTFNVRQQIWGATTRVIIKATLNDGKTFYTTQEGTDTYYNEEGIKNLALSNYLNSSVLLNFLGSAAVKSYNTASVSVDMDGNNVFTVKGWNNANIAFRNASEIQEYLNAANFSAEYWLGGTPTYGDDGWKNCVTVSGGTQQKYSDKPTAWTTLADAEAMVKELKDIPDYATATASSTLTIYAYKDGVTYYETRIKHFGDDACPWNEGEWGVNDALKPTVTTGAYPGSTAQAEGNYLGRWGVLRNNWYDLTVKSIAKIGYATPPSLEKTSTNTDDELDQYIAVDVNILSWAKRTQNVDL